MSKWKSIPGFNAYEISIEAQIRRSITNIVKKAGHRKKPGALLKPSGKYKSYVLISDDGKLKRIRTSHLMLITFKERPPFEGAKALHYDDDQSNNLIENLRWGTQADNRIDAVRNNRTAKGERNGSAKLTEEDVLQIRTKYSKGDASLDMLGTEYGVNLGTIHSIVTGLSWAHLPNMADKFKRRGPLKAAKGSECGAAKLTEDKVAQIKKLLPTTTGVKLAEIFNISVHTISCIKRNKIWKHVKV